MIGSVLLLRLTFLVALLLPALAGAASPPATESRNGAVVSAQRHAAEVGIEILRQGGNAIDAAVAMGYAEAVTNPCCGNIGGGGFMTAWLADGRAVFFNFRETAPAAAAPDMYLDASGQVIRGASLIGWKAVAVPGTVAGLDAALTRYGTMNRARVMAPAIRLAREGFILDRGDADIIARAAPRLHRNPIAAEIFLRPDGTPPQPGDRLVQADLARTLEAIAERGPDAFYHGAIPGAVEAASRQGGGLLTAADFAAYRAIETVPLRCTYRGLTILSAPPPSSGGVTLCQILAIPEGYDLHALGYHSARSVQVMTEAMRQAYLDRNTYLGDPAFVANPVERLLSREHAAAIRARIGDRATPSDALLPSLNTNEKPETTHYSVLDAQGNAVSVTYTINGAFGAGVIADDTGFLLNNEMDDFTAKPGVANMFGLVQGAANAIAPGKRPLSSMAPTIVLRDGRVFLVLGSPGGSRIITTVLQVILNIVDHRMAPQQAVDAPRLHHQWLPDTIYAEPFALSPDTKALLEQRGYTITEQTPWGAAALIAVAPPAGRGTGVASSGPDSAATFGMRPGFIYGANDSRRPAGAALGY
ncbi:MAG: gamma-glutamyltransferase [Acetobacteraceae bacterium]